MSSYFVAKKGWRYDFTLKGTRYTESWFKTKKEAQVAEALKREDLKKPKVETPTDMSFLELVNLRLDHVLARCTEPHYKNCRDRARRWVELWGNLMCSEITNKMVEQFIYKRSKVSAVTANAEIRFLRATFNHGRKRKLIKENPVDGIDFLPEEKRVKYVPPVEEVELLVNAAEPDDQKYLIAISDTMGRVGELNRLRWDDVDLKERFVILYTRKKKGGHLTPRKVPMTDRLYEIMSELYQKKDKDIPWVFWHRFYSPKDKCMKVGPYTYRSDLMENLCTKAGIKQFRYHALRHAGASSLDNENVPLGSIQKILGHENRTTTEIYLHSIENSEVDAIKTLENIREKVSHRVSHETKKHSVKK